MQAEPILQINPNKYVIFPIKYGEIWRFYKKAVASFWTVEEVLQLNVIFCIFFGLGWSGKRLWRLA